MPADLTKPFSESCCDGGASSCEMSAQSCGCDLGAKWVCQRHKDQAYAAHEAWTKYTGDDTPLDPQETAQLITEANQSRVWLDTPVVFGIPFTEPFRQETDRPTNPKKMNKLKRHYAEVVEPLWNNARRCVTEQDHFMNAALGLAAEAGEVADIHKKHFFHKPKDYRDDLILELGDVYFYLLKVQALWGLSTKEILKANRTKLFKRYEVKA